MESEIQRVIHVLAGVSPAARSATVSAGTTLEGDLSIGSLERVELRLRLEQEFGVQLGDQAFLSARNVSDLVDLVRRGSPVEMAPLAEQAGMRQSALQRAWPARTLEEVLTLQAAAAPDAHAITFLRAGRPERTMTYGSLRDAALRMAGGLRALGVEPGERVGMMLPTGLPFVAGFFGVMLCGAVPVPMYPPLRPDQLQAFVGRQSGMLQSAQARLLLSLAQSRAVDPWLRARVPTLRDIVPADDLLGSQPLEGFTAAPDPQRIGFIQYTSGSTGTPRGVALSHANLIANLRAFGVVLPLMAEDVLVSWLPLYHDMGLIGMLLAPLFYGLPLVVMGPEDFLLRPSRWLRAFHEYGGSVTAAPNFAYELCARKIPEAELRGLDLSRWRVAINGAEPVRPETVQRFTERFAAYGLAAASMRPAYGLAENTLCVSMSSAGHPPRLDHVARETLDRHGEAAPAVAGETVADFVSTGRPVPGCEVRVVDSNGQPVPSRTQGHLQFRGTSAFQGYFQDAEATRAVMAGDGWVDSGDLGYLADGEVYPTGRHKALIIKAGRNLHAEDVERAAWPAEGVRAGCVAAFALRDGEQGTDRLVVVAESRETSEAARQRIAEDIRQRVAEAMGVPPDDVRVVPPGSVPKTPSGKIRRSACRDLLQAGTLGRRAGVVWQMLHLLTDRPGWWLSQLPRLPYALWVGLCSVTWTLVVYGAGLASMGWVPGLASRWLLRLLGLRLQVAGPTVPARGPVLIVSNHCSALDPIVLMAAWPGPVRFVAAAWIADHPIVKPVLRGLRGVRITRSADHAHQEVGQMQQALRQGACLVVFAEGGLERSPGLRPFMLGPFQAAAEARVAVWPVALAGTRSAMRWGQLVPIPGPITVTFGAALVPADDRFETVSTLAAQARAHVAAYCGEALVAQRLVRGG